MQSSLTISWIGNSSNLENFSKISHTYWSIQKVPVTTMLVISKENNNKTSPKQLQNNSNSMMYFSKISAHVKLAVVRFGISTVPWVQDTLDRFFVEWGMSPVLHLLNSKWLKGFSSGCFKNPPLSWDGEWDIPIWKEGLFIGSGRHNYYGVAFSPVLGVSMKRSLVCGDSQMYSGLSYLLHKALQTSNKDPKRQGTIHGCCWEK